MSAAPITVWLGSIPITHGERDDSNECLCGHPEYFTCPDWLAGHGTVGSLLVEPVG